MPFADFGKVKFGCAFTGVGWTCNGITGEDFGSCLFVRLSPSINNPVDSSGSLIAALSSLSNDGTNLSVAYGSASGSGPALTVSVSTDQPSYT